MTNGPVTIQEARRVGYCVKGIREWNERKDRDFRDFVKNGIPYQEAVDMDDAMVNHILKKRAE